MTTTPQRDELLRHRIDHLARMLQGAEKGDVRAVHRARIASRRLRELLPLLRLHRDAAGKLGRRLRKITGRLGTLRELDVVLLLVEELRQGDRHDRRALDRIAAAVQCERSDLRPRVVVRRSLEQLRRVTAKLEDLRPKLASRDAEKAEKIGRRAVRHDWRWAADARVARRAERVGAAIDEAGAMYLPERLHAVRVALKKLRYALELSAEIAGAKTPQDLRALKHAQDLLGRLRDLQVLMDRVRHVQASLVPADLTAWRGFDALIGALEDDCRRLHGRYMRGREQLTAICDRLSDQTRAGGRRRGPVVSPAARRGAVRREATG